MRLEVMRSRGFLAALRRWWKLPYWAAALLTGAKSFADNPLIGSRRLNRLGLHAWRVRLAHRLAASRRGRLARGLNPKWREEFDRLGFIRIDDYLPGAEFEQLRAQLLGLDLPARAQQQGDTVTSRVAVGPELLARVPALSGLLRSRHWRSLMAYVASTASPPLYYLQAIDGGVAEGPPDPQTELHADTFHPSMKAWLFLTDVGEEDRPLTYVPGSHRLTAERLAWERKRSLEVVESGDRLSQRGSLRVGREELAGLGLPEPVRFAVPANTLVVADTCGFHARAMGERRSHRVELWAYCRRNPFLPWTGLDPLGWSPVQERRAGWLQGALDWLDRRGWARQHWRPAGAWKAIVERGRQSRSGTTESGLPAMLGRPTSPCPTVRPAISSIRSSGSRARSISS
jgi:hypothetical protein